MYGSACEWYEERRDTTRVVAGDASFRRAFLFFYVVSFKARPIDFSDRNVQFPDRRLRRESSAPPTFFRSAGEIFVFLSLAISTRRRRARWRITAAQERASLTATRVDRARSR